MSTYDLVIRNGLIIDGSGAEAFSSDVAVRDGKIVEVGGVAARADTEIDATGLLVTPGFVDIHTHYDGQVIWESRTQPSASHGVTTVVLGNCGVGFAPCRPEDRDRLFKLMEGVEDIPAAVMTEGLTWSWETFGEYLDAVDSRPRDLDVAAQLPHSCLRVYVMGDRGVRREAATPDDLRQMKEITADAMRAGAIGFGTSRSIMHQASDGVAIPSKDAAESELQAIAAGMRSAGHGVIEALLDFDQLEEEFGLLRRVSADNGIPVSFTVAQTLTEPVAWRRALELLAEANKEGVAMKGQVIGRPTGYLLGLNLSWHPLSFHPTYRELARLPLKTRVAELRKPAVRARILAETPGEAPYPGLKWMKRFDMMFRLGDPPNYQPSLNDSIAAQAARRGIGPLEIAYDLLLEQEGEAVLFLLVANYNDGTLDAVLEMMRDPNTVLGLGDGGAHYGLICDAGYPTFMLTYWTRDRVDGERLSVPEVVKALSWTPAQAVGLADRGLIAPGYKADLNVIDYGGLKLGMPRAIFDLPAQGRRLVQEAEGYVATIVGGIPTYRHGVATGALPGRLIRGPQKTCCNRVQAISAPR